jgi:hypothetical protein
MELAMMLGTDDHIMHLDIKCNNNHQVNNIGRGWLEVLLTPNKML